MEILGKILCKQTLENHLPPDSFDSNPRRNSPDYMIFSFLFALQYAAHWFCEQSPD